MWEPLNDCGKQINLHVKVREHAGEEIKIYDVDEIEFDQYHLVLTTVNDAPALAKEHHVFSCTQMVELGFEIEKNEDGTVK